jgi:hypothetical protein
MVQLRTGTMCCFFQLEKIGFFLLITLIADKAFCFSKTKKLVVCIFRENSLVIPLCIDSVYFVCFVLIVESVGTAFMIRTDLNCLLLLSSLYVVCKILKRRIHVHWTWIHELEHEHCSITITYWPRVQGCKFSMNSREWFV